MHEIDGHEITYKVVGWTWWGDTDYIDAPLIDDVITAVADCIRENGYCFGGDAHQRYDGCVPVLNTGQAVRCSMREWGGIMAYAEFGYRFSLDYMGWYTNSCIYEDQLKYPEENVDEHLFTHPHYFKNGIKTKRFETLKNEGEVLDVLITFDEPCNIEASDIAILWDFDAKYDERLVARVKEVTRFKTTKEFAASDIFKQTDLVNRTGYELLTAINSTRIDAPVADDEEITVYRYELIEVE